MTAQTRRAAPAAEAESYRFLERRPENWRQQLWLKGRHMTVGHLVYSMRANKQTPQEAAEDYDLPPEQVQEALLYYQRHRDVIEADAREERRYLEAQGLVIDPPAVPR